MVALDTIVWEKPAKNLDDALNKISKNCKTLQLEHRLDPYSYGEVDFGRGAGDKISNPHVADEGVQKICQALEKNKSVKALDLSGNKVGEAGVDAICSLLEKNQSVEVLFLEDNSITDEALMELADKLKKNKSIKQLSLSGNLITSKGTKALAEALKHNDTLEALWLNRNEIRDGGAKAFGSILKKNKGNLDMLCMEDNKIRERGAKVLAKSLYKNKEIKTLNLGGNKIGAKGAKYFDKAVQKNDKKGGSLEKLILDGNRFNEQDLQKLDMKASDRKVKLQGRTYYDIYGNEIEHNRKERAISRLNNYLRYHTKAKYLKQGHYDADTKAKKQL